MWIRSKHSRNEVRSHAQLESLVLQGTVAMQNLSQRLLKVQDEERRRIARDLHDSTGQILTALKINAEVLKKQTKTRSMRLQCNIRNRCAGRPGAPGDSYTVLSA